MTEAPTEEMDGIEEPTLEKVLVDIEKDPFFDYRPGTESGRMWENAKQMYNINQTPYLLSSQTKYHYFHNQRRRNANYTIFDAYISTKIETSI